MHFPLFVDLSEKKILVAGAGTIAARRVRVLCGFAGTITVVAPEVSPEFSALLAEKPGFAAPHDGEVFAAESGTQLVLHRRSFVREDLADADLVLAATNDAELNRRIAELCRTRGIPVNNCSDQGMCDFQFPSIIEEDGVVIGINASGKNHSRVKETRRRLERALNHGDAAGKYGDENPL